MSDVNDRSGDTVAAAFPEEQHTVFVPGSNMPREYFIDADEEYQKLQNYSDDGAKRIFGVDRGSFCE